MMDGHELRAVGKGSFDLDLGDHIGDASHDLPPAEQSAAQVHQFGNAPAVADEFQQLRGDEGDRFRMVKPQAPSQALLCQEAGVVQQELIDLAR